MSVVGRQAERWSSDISGFSGKTTGIKRATPINETQNGAVSGTLTMTGSIDANTGTGSITMTYANFNDGDGYTYDGAVTVNVDGYDMTYDIMTDWTMNCTLWTIRSAGSNISLTGSMRMQENVQTKTDTLTINMAGRDNIGNDSFRFDNYVETTVYDNFLYPTTGSETYNGRVYAGRYGYVDVNTVSPCIYSSPVGDPGSGGPIILAGAGNTRAAITPVSTTYVKIEVDNNGDGAYEDKNTYAWYNLEGSPISVAPVANSGPDQTVNVGSVVTLDGRGSKDPNGATLTYSWTMPAKPGASSAFITSPSAPVTTFTADVAGNYTISLSVSNGTTNSTDTVVVTALSGTTVIPQPITPPTAVASAGDGQVTISWNRMDGQVSGYNIYWSTTPGVSRYTGTKIPVGVALTSYTHTGLTNGTTYHYVVTASYFDGTQSGESPEVSATPHAGATMTLTQDPTNVTDTTATLNGSLNNPAGYLTTVWFEYGTSTAYGDATPHTAYAQTGTIPITANVTGLFGRTTYFVRLVTQNSGGTFYGPDKTFNTYITPQVLASGLNGPNDLTIDSTNVYWTGWYDGSVNAISINSGPATTLAAEGPSNYASGIAVDGASVYWTEYGSGKIKSVPVSGGTVTTIAFGLDSPIVLKVRSGSLYALETSAIVKVDIAGGAVTVLATEPNFYSMAADIAVDSESVYWSDINGGAIKKVSTNGGIVVTLAAGLSRPRPIATDSTSVYWAELDAIPLGNGIRKTGLNGGTVTTLAAANCPTDLAVDSAYVYWAEHCGGTSLSSIKKVGINGGDVAILAQGASAAVQSMAVDSTSIYWIVSGDIYSPSLGSIRKIPKSY